MNPVDFPESNVAFGPPEGMTEDEVGTIPAYLRQLLGGKYDGVKVVIVAWQPDEQELEMIKRGAPVYVCMLGGLAPHYLTTSFEVANQVRL